MLENLIVGLNLYTYHLDGRQGLNNETPGIYVSYQVPDSPCQPTAGIVKNSIGNTSVWLACTTSFLNEHVRLTYGAINGYHDGIRLLFIPSYVLKFTDHQQMNIGYIPKYRGGSDAFTFSIEYKF